MQQPQLSDLQMCQPHNPGADRMRESESHYPAGGHALAAHQPWLHLLRMQTCSCNKQQTQQYIEHQLKRLTPVVTHEQGPAATTNMRAADVNKRPAGPDPATGHARYPQPLWGPLAERTPSGDVDVDSAGSALHTTEQVRYLSPLSWGPTPNREPLKHIPITGRRPGQLLLAHHPVDTISAFVLIPTNPQQRRSTSRGNLPVEPVKCRS